MPASRSGLAPCAVLSALFTDLVMGSARLAASYERTVSAGWLAARIRPQRPVHRTSSFQAPQPSGPHPAEAAR
jgi:hypothetical protein